MCNLFVNVIKYNAIDLWQLIDASDLNDLETYSLEESNYDLVIMHSCSNPYY